MSFTIPNSADVPQTATYGNGAMAQMFSSDLLILTAAHEGTCVQVGNCALSASGTAGKVQIAAGTGFWSGTQADVAAQDNVACTSNADATNPKWILYELDASQVLQANVGTAAAAPVPPVPTTGRIVVAAVFVPANATAVDTLTSTANGNAKIVDKRVDKAMIDYRYYSGHGTYTWTKPTNARVVFVDVIGPGTGGAGGRCGAAASVRGGGGGGANGGRKRAWLSAADLGSTETVTVGTGGTAGSGGASSGADGTNGGAGTSSSFGAHVVVSNPGGVSNAQKGTSSPGGAGGSGTSDSENALLGVSAATQNIVGSGGSTSTSTTAGAGTAQPLLPGTGGGGGGLDASNNRRDGGVGGAGDPSATITGGTAGTGSNGAGGGAGTATTRKHQFGAGGGGGSASASSATNGGDGGAGSAPGGGGGGGGAGTSGGSARGGNGAAGADGAVLVVSYP